MSKTAIQLLSYLFKPSIIRQKKWVTNGHWSLALKPFLHHTLCTVGGLLYPLTFAPHCQNSIEHY